MRWFWVVVGTVVALIAFKACGGSDKAASPFSDTDLKTIAMVTSEGLPWQVVPQTDNPVSNPQAAQLFSDPSKWESDFDSWGRIGGHIATFGSLGAEGPAVQTQVESYKTVSGAEEAFSAVDDFTASGQALSAFATQGYDEAKIDKIDAAEVGDQSVSYRLSVVENGEQMDTDVILFRRGSVLAQAAVGTTPDDTDSDAVEAVAKQMDGRILSILKAPESSTPGE
jgi:hypothetical protein